MPTIFTYQISEGSLQQSFQDGEHEVYVDLGNNRYELRRVDAIQVGDRVSCCDMPMPGREVTAIEVL